MEIPGHIDRKWSPATPGLLNRDASALAQLPIDQTVQPAVFRGGLKAAQEAVATVLSNRVCRGMPMIGTTLNKRQPADYPPKSSLWSCLCS